MTTSNKDDGCGYKALLPYVSEDKRKDFDRYVNELIESAPYAFDFDFLGFISDYADYASLLRRKADAHDHLSWPGDRSSASPPLTVYDIGCGGALQHLLFDSRIHYVGIDTLGTPEPKFFRGNCRFIKGKFSDVIKTLDIDRHDAVGIANMSLLYFSSEDPCTELFDRTFRTKFVL
jgi:hypothetical protein